MKTETIHPAIARYALEHGVLLLPMEPQPEYIQSSGRWSYPLFPPHDNDGKCPFVVTASREFWEYIPDGARPHQPGDTIRLEWDCEACIGTGTRYGEECPVCLGEKMLEDFGPIASVEYFINHYTDNYDQTRGEQTVLDVIDRCYEGEPPEHWWLIRRAEALLPTLRA